ncbi:hypothetical protein CDD83_2058 [Cordyceps sp. RAO-2017]|nr:hypothetical protein CDD83_2058 [Cordyceps sp. RAO-2017]
MLVASQRIACVNASRQVSSVVGCGRPRRCLHLTAAASAPRRRHFFTSNPFLSNSAASGDEPAPPEPTSAPAAKRKPPRAATAKKSLRRVAIIAQQPKRDKSEKAAAAAAATTTATTTISATCVAEAFNMPVVVEVLESHGFAIDPDGTGFDASEVVHARSANGGDIFVFPSGTVVTWCLPADAMRRQLAAAAEEAHGPEQCEAEELDFVTDTSKAESTMRGDVVVLGTRREDADGDRLDTTLAKVAFSSGLARSTKLAVLESALTAYIESTRTIPARLSQGAGVPVGRRLILRKTGELLGLRARLNHYSELTDSLPDIFWDSRAELGLEGYYDLVGRALDVNVRIRTLNQKMDYAQEIASVLREVSSEQHGTRLELIIILLIAVEVVFELRRICLEWADAAEPPAPSAP